MREGDGIDEDERPIGAFVLSLIGGILILFEGAVLSIAASVVGASGFIGAGNLLGGLGFLGLFFGFVIVVLAIQVFRNPDAHVAYGIAILVLSLVSILGGGGFFLGLILGAIGGILAIVFEESEELEFKWDRPPQGNAEPRFE